MKKLFIGVGVSILIVAAVAFATSSQDSRPRAAGTNLDTVTFPDGAVVSSAYVGGWSTTNIVLVQVKQTDGKTCYGIATQSSTGGASISCPP